MNKAKEQAPLRKVIEDTGGATVRLECGHIIDRRKGFVQPKRRRCDTCRRTALSEDWRRVLSARSMRDKIGVARDCEFCPVGDLPIIAELVRDGILVWLDRAILPLVAVRSDRTVQVGIDSDVYLLTPKGVALCDANGIARR